MANTSQASSPPGAARPRTGAPTLDSNPRGRRLLTQVRTVLPHGGDLSEESWEARHRAITLLVWAHAVGLFFFALVRRYELDHAVLEAGAVALGGLAASYQGLTRTLRMAAATLGLLTSSALLVHFSGGVIEMHFHFFVMVVVVSLYQAWLPFLLAVTYVVVHHGFFGTIAPESVYNHPAALAHPFKWAVIHGAFILGESVAALTAWRFTETAHDKARKAEASRRHLASIVESSSAAIIGTSLEGIIQSWNRGAELLYGYTEQEAIGKPFAMLIPTERAGEEHRLLARVAKGELIDHFETVRLTKDDRRVDVSVSASPVWDDTGAIVAAASVALDITKAKRLETELQVARDDAMEKSAELERSNRDLEQFAYVASHDLQEPLRMVTNYVQLLGRRYSDALDENAREFIGYAVSGAMRMQALINDLLVYSRVGSRGRSLAPVAVDEVVETALANLEAARRDSGAEIVCGGLPQVMGDQGQLVQLFQNLLANAIKFTGDQPPRVEISAQDRGSEWLCAVEDNGIGFDPEYRDRIFTIFQRLHTREEYPGTGIGLAVCKKIVEGHGGRIWVESQPGEGSTFFFTLPGLEGGEADAQPGRSDRHLVGRGQSS